MSQSYFFTVCSKSQKILLFLGISKLKGTKVLRNFHGRMIEEGLVDFGVSKFTFNDDTCLVSSVDLSSNPFNETACESDLGSITETETGVHKLFYSLDGQTIQADWLQKLMQMQNPM